MKKLKKLIAEYQSKIDGIDIQLLKLKSQPICDNRTRVIKIIESQRQCYIQFIKDLEDLMA